MFHFPFPAVVISLNDQRNLISGAPEEDRLVHRIRGKPLRSGVWPLMVVTAGPLLLLVFSWLESANQSGSARRSSLEGSLSTRVEEPVLRADSRAVPEIPALATLDNPPQVPGLNREQVEPLTKLSRQLGHAMMYVGHPEGDSGSAFVISRKHRLVATNAHVAAIMQEVGSMVAIRSGTFFRYPVKRVWYHPDYDRARREGVFARTRDGWIRERKHLGPDVAVLELEAHGPDLPVECTIARPNELDNLIGKPIGLLGFSGPWPPAGRPMTPEFKWGRVNLLTDFVPAWGGSHRWEMIDGSAPGNDGDSGGPIFTPDGHVVAIFAWVRSGDGGDCRPGADTAAGLRIDCLWELLERQGLSTLVPAIERVGADSGQRKAVFRDGAARFSGN